MPSSVEVLQGVLEGGPYDGMVFIVAKDLKVVHVPGRETMIVDTKDGKKRECYISHMYEDTGTMTLGRRRIFRFVAPPDGKPKPWMNPNEVAYEEPPK